MLEGGVLAVGLAVEVGLLASMLKEDPETVGWLRDMFDSVNEVLVENGLPPHVEPEQLPELNNRCRLAGYPYSFLHYLRRVAAHVADDPRWSAEPFPYASDPQDDPLLDRQTELSDSHLVCHSDSEGFYVPLPFKDVIFTREDRVPGGALGSSHALHEELVRVAPALGIGLEGGKLSDAEAESINRQAEAEAPLWIEKAVWLSLFEASRLSLEHKAAICFM